MKIVSKHLPSPCTFTFKYVEGTHVDMFAYMSTKHAFPDTSHYEQKSRKPAKMVAKALKNINKHDAIEMFHSEFMYVGLESKYGLSVELKA